MAKRHLTSTQWSEALARYERGEPVGDIARDFGIKPRTVTEKARQWKREKLHCECEEIIERHRMELDDLDGKIRIGAAKLEGAETSEDLSEAQDYLSATKNLIESIAIRQSAERKAWGLDALPKL